ncbi:hypothetical protein [Vibrio hyugaensis]|uniref:Superinfection immunity protein n=1 Tax=Vibrio hyugaensis TaxID=1534743 RepID=A0ABQ5XXD7_9VIBR|nr:hypothetical protein [Vibrio hyugaensis]GLR02967.1 hypothetical protein GCM10007906_05540 [Vibrio hyugaensis]
MSVIPGAIVTAIIIIAWFVPFMIITTSRQTGRPEKFLWVCALLFVSWFCWIIYWLAAPLKPIQDED